VKVALTSSLSRKQLACCYGISPCCDVEIVGVAMEDDLGYVSFLSRVRSEICKNAPISFSMFVRPYATNREPLKGFSWCDIWEHHKLAQVENLKAITER
jgi:hypothetical protein